jgi:hypothetical protein
MALSSTSLICCLKCFCLKEPFVFVDQRWMSAACPDCVR